MNLERAIRRQLTSDQRRRIAERCENSGLSRSEFARRNHVALSSLQRWLRELHATSITVPSVVFQEIAVPPPMTAPPSALWAVEIVAPDGMTVRCRNGWSMEDVARLLRGRAC